MTQPTSKDTFEHLQKTIARALTGEDSYAVTNAIDQHIRQLINDYHRNTSVLTKARAE